MKQNGVKSPWLVPAPPQANNGLAALWEGSLGPWQDAEAQGGAGLSAGRGGRLQPRLRAHLLPAHLPVPRKPRPTSDVTVDPGPTPAHPETWRRTRTALLLVTAAPALLPPVDSRSMRPARAQLSLAQSPRLRCAPAGVAGSRPTDFSPDRGL